MEQAMIRGAGARYQTRPLTGVRRREPEILRIHGEEAEAAKVILVLADEHLMHILHEISETSCRP